MKIKVIISQCTLCGACIKACPLQLISIENKRIKIKHQQCIQCRVCLVACQHKALCL